MAGQELFGVLLLPTTGVFSEPSAHSAGPRRVALPPLQAAPSAEGLPVPVDGNVPPPPAASWRKRLSLSVVGGRWGLLCCSLTPAEPPLAEERKDQKAGGGEGAVLFAFRLFCVCASLPPSYKRSGWWWRGGEGILSELFSPLQSCRPVETVQCWMAGLSWGQPQRGPP